MAASDKKYPFKIIADPVHGDIGLSELETNLIDTPTFQRLRRLKQLGFASMVYPNATYSRFAHSLGVLYITDRVIKVFQRKEQLKDEVDVDKLRVAALLHDIGHYPYSHLMEYIDWDRYSSVYLEKESHETEDKTPRVTPYPKHDKLGRLIITQRGDIRQILENHNIEPDEIAALIEGKHPTIPNPLHKSLDVDRMDYLIRDSLNTGVPYGRIDINYLLNNLAVTEEGEIVVNAKARIAAEHLLVSRYFMFNTVYLHKTVFGFEEVVRRIILLLLDKGRIYGSGEEIEKMIGDNSYEFLNFHDGYVDKFIDEYAAKDDREPLTVLCQAVRLRHPPKLIYEVVDLSERKSDRVDRNYVLFKRCMEKDIGQIADKCQISPDCLIWRETKDVEFEAMNPFRPISSAPDSRGEEMKELVRIQEPSGKISNLLEDKKSIIHHLSQLQLKVIRLYAVESDKQKVEKIKAEVKSRLQ